MSNYIFVYFIGEVVAPTCTDGPTCDASMTFSGNTLLTDANNKFVATDTQVGRQDGMGRVFFSKNQTASSTYFANLINDPGAMAGNENPFSHPIDTLGIYGFTVVANNGDTVVVRTTGTNSVTDFVNYPAGNASLPAHANKTAYFQNIAGAGFTSTKIADIGGGASFTSTTGQMSFAMTGNTNPNPGQSFWSGVSGVIDVSGPLQTLMTFTVGGNTLTYGDGSFPAESGTVEMANYIANTIAGGTFLMSIRPAEISLTGAASWVAGKYCVCVDIECVVNP